MVGCSGHTPAYQDNGSQTGPLLPAVPRAVGPFQDRMMEAVLARHIADGTLNTARCDSSLRLFAGTLRTYAIMDLGHEERTEWLCCFSTNS